VSSISLFACISSVEAVGGLVITWILPDPDDKLINPDGAAGDSVAGSAFCEEPKITHVEYPVAASVGGSVALLLITAGFANAGFFPPLGLLAPLGFCISG
jgi:hypothetical protein